jgi:large subunit ribosomal protein L4
MFRALCSRQQQGLIRVTATGGWSGVQSHSSRLALLAPSSSQAVNWLSTTPAAAAVLAENDLPPNLTFDRKSSFAPKKPILARPKPTPKPPQPNDSEETEDGEVDYEDEEEDYEEDYDINFDTTPQFAIPLPDRLKIDVQHALDGSVNGTLWLDPTVFGADIRIDLIKQNVDYIRNKLRGQRKSKTKTIGEVSGSGKKVRAQKGSGMARAGHSRPAHWRGGAKAHGPKNNRDYGDVKMNKKAKRLAMVATLSQKLKEGNVILLDHLKLPSHKTKDWAGILESVYGIAGQEGTSALILDHYLENEEEEGEQAASFHGVPINLWVASGNQYKIKVANQRFANVYDILKHDKLVLTLDALQKMEARWNDN